MKVVLNLNSLESLSEDKYSVDLEYAIGVSKDEVKREVARLNKEHKAKTSIASFNAPSGKGAPSASFTLTGTKRDVTFVAAGWLDADPDMAQLTQDWSLEFKALSSGNPRYSDARCSVDIETTDMDEEQFRKELPKLNAKTKSSVKLAAVGIPSKKYNKWTFTLHGSKDELVKVAAAFFNHKADEAELSSKFGLDFYQI